MSIQSLILLPEPMFNEPGYEGMQGTQEGQVGRALISCQAVYTCVYVWCTANVCHVCDSGEV